MPRGQTPSNAGPTECDSQALLILLSSCTHFHNKFSPQCRNLLHAISTIRNEVMHNGEMKVSDADRMSFIQQIIQLLEDPVHLKSLEDCKTAVENIHKIENESLDVFFNVDNEMKALKEVVSELRLESGTRVKILNTIDSLKEECRNLREQLTSRFEDAEKELKLHETRMDTIQRDVQSVKEETDTALKQQEEKCQGMHAAVTQLSESMYTMSTCVAQHELRFVAVEENVQAFGRKLEELETNTLPQRVHNSHSIRTSAGEGISDCDTSEAPKRRKRPESDGLQQLKNQTEDSLDTFRKIVFISTTQTEEAKKLLQQKRSVVIKGNPGEGKTSTALHLIDNDNYRDQRVVVSRPKDWKKVDTDWVKIIVLEDIFGQHDLDSGRLQEWIDGYLWSIQKHVDVGKLQVIITIRNDILLKACSKLKSFKLFSSDMSLTLSSNKLTYSDKISILNRELKKNNKDLTVDNKEQCIANFSGLIGFPQCCSRFAGDKDLFGQGPDFFRSPQKFLVDNITNLNANSFLSLAFLFCIFEIEEEYLSPSQMKECKKYLPVLEDLAKYLNILSNESALISLRELYDHYSGLYVKKAFSYKHHSIGNFSYKHHFGGNFLYKIHFGGEVRKFCIQFSQATVYEAVGQVLGDRCPEMLVKYGDFEYLYTMTYAAETKDITSHNVFIPVSVYGLLVERMVHDVIERGFMQRVVNHSAIKQCHFLMTLKNELLKSNRIRDFVMAKRSYGGFMIFLLPFDHDLSEGECITFLQYVLEHDEDLVRLVYSHFMEFLVCTHNNKDHDCWQCKEKQTLLELALYYHHCEIADKLITMNARYTHVSLCNAARHGDLSRVHTILEYLKTSLVFDLECIEVKKGLCRAYISGNQDVIDILLQEGITLDRKHVVYVVQHGDINALMKVVEHLKCHNKWDPHQEHYKSHYFDHPFMYLDTVKDFYYIKNQILRTPCSTALYITYCYDQFDMADYLVTNETEVSLEMLPLVSENGSQQAVARVIQNLKVAGIWDPKCDHASEALETAYRVQNYDVCDILIQEGVSLTMKNFTGICISIFVVSLRSVQKAIQHLKDTGSWDPKCDEACEVLENAFVLQDSDVGNLLIQEGVSLTMKNVCGVLKVSRIQFWKDDDQWDPKCDEASKALAHAFHSQKFDVCELLIQEGVSLTMNNFAGVICRFSAIFESVKRSIQHLKKIDSWDPKCNDASIALENAYRMQKYDVCDLLVQEGVSLIMNHLSHIILRDSLGHVKTALKRFKDTGSWDPKCDDASEALAEAYGNKKFDVCDLLIQEGVSLKMKNLASVICTFNPSLESVQKAVQHLKMIGSWDPKCNDASKALEETYNDLFFKKHDLCDLLVQEGVSLTMKNLSGIIMKFGVSLETIIKAVKHLKDNNTWNPKDDCASGLLKTAYYKRRYDVCDLLIQEGVSLTMKDLPFLVLECDLESLWKAIQHLKDTKQWDSSSDHAVNLLTKAKVLGKTDQYNLLIKEGIYHLE